MSETACGGCRGLGAHSPRCFTQPGSLYRLLADRADTIAESVGPGEMELANLAWELSARLKRRAETTPQGGTDLTWLGEDVGHAEAERKS